MNRQQKRRLIFAVAFREMPRFEEVLIGRKALSVRITRAKRRAMARLLASRAWKARPLIAPEPIAA